MTGLRLVGPFTLLFWMPFALVLGVAAKLAGLDRFQTDEGRRYNEDRFEDLLEGGKWAPRDKPIGIVRHHGSQWTAEEIEILKKRRKP